MRHHRQKRSHGLFLSPFQGNKNRPSIQPGCNGGRAHHRYLLSLFFFIIPANLSCVCLGVVGAQVKEEKGLVAAAARGGARRQKKRVVGRTDVSGAAAAAATAAAPTVVFFRPFLLLSIVRCLDPILFLLILSGEFETWSGTGGETSFRSRLVITFFVLEERTWLVTHGWRVWMHYVEERLKSISPFTLCSRARTPSNNFPPVIIKIPPEERSSCSRWCCKSSSVTSNGKRETKKQRLFFSVGISVRWYSRELFRIGYREERRRGYCRLLTSTLHQPRTISQLVPRR